MNYFNDLIFVNHGNAKYTACQARKRLFEGYYGIQFHYYGKVRAWVNDSPPESVDTPHVFITWPGAEFNYGAPEGTVRHQAHVCFRGPRVDRYLREGLLELRDRNLFLPIHDPERFLQTMLHLFSLLETPGATSHARAVLLLEELLIQLREQPALPPRTRTLYGGQLRQLRDKLAEAPEKAWSFEQEAAAMSLSYVHFRRLFQQFTGLPPGQFLLECRLRRAETLLTSGTLRIGEIALACGFESEFHFSRIFKRHRTLSPSAFRERYGTF